MNLISQNCLSGHLYRDCYDIEYGNPFIWSVIDFNSMLYLIQNWDKINFDNFIIQKDNNWNFSIIVDEKVKVQYVHYKLDPNAKNVLYKGVNVYYYKIWEYIIKKYIDRVKRMKDSNEIPLFCICNFKTIFPDAIYNKSQLDILSKYKNVRILNGCEDFEPLDAAKQFYKQFLSNEVKC